VACQLDDPKNGLPRVLNHMLPRVQGLSKLRIYTADSVVCTAVPRVGILTYEVESGIYCVKGYEIRGESRRRGWALYRVKDNRRHNSKIGDAADESAHAKLLLN
jgi:hypothetical protein